MPDQFGIPVDVAASEIARENSLGGAIELCMKAAGHHMDKQAQSALGVDKAQFSRWLSGTEGIIWPKLARLMQQCGNDVPLRWMLLQFGYDLASLRKRETETETALREARERIAALELRNSVLIDAINGRRA